MEGHLKQNIEQGDRRSIARAISMVENNVNDSVDLLTNLDINKSIPVIGITGPPGAGKSSLVSALITTILKDENKEGKPNQVAVVAVDPTSPFTKGALLGDRLRMAEHYNNPNVYIRSLASRGALGGLSAKALMVVDVLRAAKFDYILVETVGVGQSEVEIAGLANTTVVTLVPESGDEIQALKSGIMEIADIFVVNKSDRDGADIFAAGIQKTLHEQPYNSEWTIPVLKTIATQNIGIDLLFERIKAHSSIKSQHTILPIIAEHAWRIIQQEKMKSLSIHDITNELSVAMNKPDFNLYVFIKGYV